jgi:hypothetical protein
MIARLLGSLPLAGCAVFAGILFAEFETGTRRESSATGVSANTASPVAVPRDKGGQLDEQVATVLARPLFNPDRRPAALAKSKSATELGLKSLRLAGIITAPGRRFAIFAVTGGKPLTLPEGQNRERLANREHYATAGVPERFRRNDHVAAPAGPGCRGSRCAYEADLRSGASRSANPRRRVVQSETGGQRARPADRFANVPANWRWRVWPTRRRGHWLQDPRFWLPRRPAGAGRTLCETCRFHRRPGRGIPIHRRYPHRHRR